MSDKTQEVLDLARQQVRANRNEQRQERVKNEKHWRSAFLIGVSIVAVALIAIPTMPLDEKMAFVLQGMCSQEHVITLGGIKFPICARCSGIYISTIVSLVFLWARGRLHAGRIPPWPITSILLLFGFVMAVDGFNSMAEGMGYTPLYQSINQFRVITGLGFGVGMAVLIILMINMSLRQNVDDEMPIIGTWRELGAILAFDALIWAAIYGNASFLAWPLAILSFLGMVGVIFVVNLLLVSLVMGYDQTITTLTQLARPATIAIIPTILMIGGMALFRIWIETGVAG
jgi:uncharacterized membrane protein